MYERREADRGGAFVSLPLAGEHQIIQKCGGKSKCLEGDIQQGILSKRMVTESKRIVIEECDLQGYI